MWPLTASYPKALLPVGGMPFFEMQLRWLSSAGVTDVVIAVGAEKQAAWLRHLADRKANEGPKIEVTAELEPLDTAGALVGIRDRLADRFLVLNGDVILDIDPDILLGSWNDDCRARLTLTVVDDASSYGAVLLDGSKVRAFEEKPEFIGDARATVNAGLYLMDRSVLEELHPGPRSLEREVFPLLASRGELDGVLGKGPWLDVGTPQRYIEAHATVAGGWTMLYELDRQRGGFVMPEGEWSWIGLNAAVDPEARLRHAVVLDEASIAAGAAVQDAIVGWRAEVKDKAVVADYTVVGEGSVIGAGCELRHGVRVAPGIELGSRAVTFSAPT